ncbi:response regulator [Thermodesulfitimonas sp.]
MKKILVIDDDAKARKLYRVILERAGYAVWEAAGAPEGIRLAETEKVDLIILDIHLPEMDSLSAVRILKAYGPTKDMPVVAVTALWQCPAIGRWYSRQELTPT